MGIKNLPDEERPREKAFLEGVETLSDSELLAILLNNGTKESDVLTLATELLIKYNGLSSFSKLSIFTLIKEKGIKKAKAIKILAAIEFGKRCLKSSNTNKINKNANDFYINYGLKIAFDEVESLLVLPINSLLEVISVNKITSGNVGTIISSPKVILKEVIKSGMNRYIIMHNHPSGNVKPSLNDNIVTLRLKEISASFDIVLYDHIIVGANTYYSYRENNRKEILL